MSSPSPRDGAPPWLVVLMGMASMLFVLVMMDRLKSHDPSTDDGRVIPVSSGVASPRSARVLVIVLDSLRYETAMDAEVMPQLAALRAEGVSARVNSIYNAVSIPSLSTLFSGRENVTLLGFAANFVRLPSPQEESLFRQLHEAGVKSTVLSGGEFNQFGSAIAWPLSRDVRRTPEWNAARMLAAVDALARSESGLVVVHLPYTDHVAHSDRVGAPRYRRQFRWADSLIPKFREKLPAGAVMVVLGDHGHTLDGRHGSGLVTPTTAVYVGGPFRRGVDLGLINLASNRYLLNGAFGLPVPAGGYTGGVYPEAFVNAEKTGRSPEDAAELSAPVPQLTMKSSALFVWLSFGVMVAIWLNLALAEWSPLRFRAWHHGLTLLGLAAAWLPLLWAGPVALGAGLTVLILADHAGTNWRRRLVWTAGLVAAAWALHGWGRLLGGMIDAQQALSLPWLATVWFVIGTVGAVAALRFDRTRLIWVGLAVPGLLLMPTHAFHGWTSLVVPVLFCWFGQRLVVVVRERRQAGRPFMRREIIWCTALALGLFVLLQAEAASRGVNYAFQDWYSLIPSWGASNLAFMTVAGMAANFILLCPDPGSRPMRLLALGLAVALYPLQWRLWPLAPGLWLGLLAGALAAGLWARRHGSRAARPLLMWFALLLWLYLMRLPEPNHAAMCCLMAALVLAARFMRRFPQPAAEESDRALLVLLGVVVTGHALCRWSIMDLEWRVTYDWITPPQAERFWVGILVLLIFKGLAPWWVVQRAVAWAQDRAGPLVIPARTRAAVVIKCASLLMLMTGLGFAYNAIGPYVVAAQQALVFGALTLYVIMGRSREPTTPGPVR